MPNTSRLRFSKRTRRGALIAFAMSAVALLGALALAGVPRAPLASGDAGVTHLVVIENMAFSPRVLRVHVGDRVTFENRDLMPHTATAKPAATFDSGLIKPGESWSFRPARAGTTPYACSFHPTMEATLIVEPAAGP